MRRLRVRALARAEITAAFDWYFLRSANAAARFIDEVDRALHAIEAAPTRRPVIRGQLRRLLLSGFPYAVYYKVYPKTVSIVGVIHGRRHPRVWMRRG